MEAIEYLIELDFGEPALQRTPIVLNRANKNSVQYLFKIYQGSKEINYLSYFRAELVFQKSDKTNVVDEGIISASGISYVLDPHIFDVTGVVTGYVNLFTANTLSATLHYNFKIISDLINIDRLGQFYARTIEEIAAEFNTTVEEARRILKELEDESFVTNAEFNTLDARVSEIAKDNFIINPLSESVSIWQRGTTFVSTGGNSYTADRWRMYAPSNIITVSKDDDGSLKIKTNGTITTAVVYVNQLIEEYRNLVGKKITFSFDIKNDYELVVQMLISVSATVLASLNIPISSTYKRYSITCIVPENTANPLQPNISIPRDTPADKSANIKNVKLEIGDKSTPFVPRLYAEELALCQRYYEKSYSIDIAPGTATIAGAHYDPNATLTSRMVSFYWPYKVPKRISPTITIFSAAGTVGKISGSLDSAGNSYEDKSYGGVSGGRNTNQGGIYHTTATTHYGYFAHWVADAEL